LQAAKTKSRIKNGETSAKREELFLDEGWRNVFYSYSLDDTR